MPLTDQQIDRLEELSGKNLLSGAELDELESLDKAAVAPEAPSIAQIAGGLGTEVAAGVAGQAAGAALAPFTMGISYPVLAFSGGFGGSLAAQKVEGRETPSWGRAIFAGAINLIPGGKAVSTAGKFIGREAAKGAALGVGEATATALVDDQRKPTMSEVIGYGMTGAAFGGAIGGVIRGGPAVARKIFGKTPEQVDAMVAAGEIRPIDLTPAQTPELANFPNPANAERNAARELALASEAAQQNAPIVAAATAPPSEFLQQARRAGKDLWVSIVPSRYAGREVSDRIIQMKNEVTAFEEIGSKIGREVDDAIAASPDQRAAREAVDTFLNDPLSGPLPEPLTDLMPKLSLARGKISELQSKLLGQIDVGITPSKPGMAEKIYESIDTGDYLTREYRFFTDVNYKPTPAARDKAMAELKAGYMEAGSTLDVATTKAKMTLEDLEAKKLSSIRDERMYPSSLDGFMKERKEITPALREYLGEITQPGERIRGTLTRLARSVERDAADDFIRKNLVAKGVATVEGGVNKVPLALRRRGEEGNRLFVDPDTQRALNILYLDGGDKTSANAAKELLKDAWFSSIAASKGVKVLMNPPSYAVQVYGNMANLLGMGINPMKHAGQGIKLALADYGPFEKLIGKSPEGRRKLLEEMNEMTRYGIKGANIVDSDLRAGLQGSIIGGRAQKVFNPFARAYTVPDTIGRYVGWKANQDMLRKVFPQAGDETVKRYAATLINDTYQNYDRLSSSVRHLSKVGVIPQFASFTAEFARNQWHQGRLIAEMASGKLGRQFAAELGPANVEAMRKEAARRLAGVAVVYGGTYAALKSWNSEHGVDEAKSAALRESIIPGWDEDRMLAMSLSQDGKTLKYANPSYIVPHALGLSAFEAGMSGKPLEVIGGLMSEELVGEGTFTGQALYGAIANRNPRTGRPISSETNTLKRIGDQIAFYFNQSFTPGVSREMDKAAEALRGQGKLSVADVIKRQAGIRINDIDVPEAAGYRIGEVFANARNAKSGYTKVWERNRHSDAEREEIYQTANRQRADAMQTIQKHVANLRTLGFDDAAVIKAMKDGGMGTKDILDTLNGTFEPFDRTPRQTATDIWDEEISALAPREQDNRIRAIASKNPTLAHSLLNRKRAAARADARGEDPTDALVRKLGVADNERADYILGRMKQSQYPESVLESFRRKQLVTPEVLRQIRAAQNE